MAISCALLPLLLLALEFITFLAPSDLGLTPEHLLFVLKLELIVRSVLGQRALAIPLLIARSQWNKSVALESVLLLFQP